MTIKGDGAFLSAFSEGLEFWNGAKNISEVPGDLGGPAWDVMSAGKGLASEDVLYGWVLTHV